MFVLSCQAVGRPVPRIHWLLDGQRLPRDHNMPRRIAAFQSGTTPALLETLLKYEYTGLPSSNAILYGGQWWFGIVVAR